MKTAVNGSKSSKKFRKIANGELQVEIDWRRGTNCMVTRIRHWQTESDIGGVR
jgi:hypothetical protein